MDTDRQRNWAFMLAIAIISGGGGSWLTKATGPSTFTTKQATEMEDRLITSIDKIEEQQKNFVRAFTSITADGASVRAKVSSLEGRVSRMEVKLDKVYDWMEPKYRSK